MSTKDVSVKLKSWKPAQKSRRSSEDKVGTEGLEGMAGAGVVGMAAWHSLQF